MKKNRHYIQIFSAFLFNSYLLGFRDKTIFKGKTKMACVPILNCYSCPSALGACPIGALQASLGDINNKTAFYVLGTIMLFGILVGRLICGFLCLFGFIQDLLYKIPTKKISISAWLDKKLRFVKYIIFISFVIIFPMVLTNKYGLGAPYFCKLICPAGMLEGGIPLVLMSSTLKETIGFLYYWKFCILVFVVIISIFIYRPFCKYICPLGALYGLFNRFSFYRMEIDKNKCIDCKVCERNCRMQVKVLENINSAECIRCMECKNICPKGAIETNFFEKKL
ncbi:4Fe-4S binding protein [Enterocloster bolteae]|uniref:4Fe-4S binding protein n=1 Tax=Clostridia TaxID=186801 RepID=UPI000E4D817A|nr:MULTISPECIES: 4Fe-4S binding protein [Clostridia]MCB7090046.1 4Fe-4S binding protein [Enterocloster bolteae]MCH1934947.1 4Fe-4S binding protein [Enterocloster sp. OA11]RHB68080.1 4Fe-4S binding protein [Hungatella hathewayi]RHM76514.1 4Fe-4S binding protein [Hungatella hathewayi]